MPQAGPPLGSGGMRALCLPACALSLPSPQESWLDFCVDLVLSCNMAPCCDVSLPDTRHRHALAQQLEASACWPAAHQQCGTALCLTHTSCSAASAECMEASINSYDDNDKMPLGTVAWAGEHPILYGGAADGSVLVFYLNP